MHPIVEALHGREAIGFVRREWDRDWPGERRPTDKTIRDAYREVKAGSSKYKCVPEIIVA